MGTFVQLYSDDAAHGYTMLLSLTQSSAVIHTYPETNVVTINIETCESSETMMPIIASAQETLRKFFDAQSVRRIECQTLPLFVDPPIVRDKKVA